MLNRDAERLLLFYKHNAQGTFNDGDIHHARYTCYKFRNKKEKLWRTLEKKYGVPVLQTDEYKALRLEKEQTQTDDDEEETVNLDDEEDGSNTDANDEGSQSQKQEAPDL